MHKRKLEKQEDELLEHNCLKGQRAHAPWNDLEIKQFKRIKMLLFKSISILKGLASEPYGNMMKGSKLVHVKGKGA